MSRSTLNLFSLVDVKKSLINDLLDHLMDVVGLESVGYAVVEDLLTGQESHVFSMDFSEFDRKTIKQSEIKQAAAEYLRSRSGN